MVIMAMAALSGCATITQGTQKTISFKLEPKEAICDILRVGDSKLGRVSGTSNTIFVGKDKDDIVVTCNAEGYEQSTTKAVSGATGAGATGVLIDLALPTWSRVPCTATRRSHHRHSKSEHGTCRCRYALSFAYVTAAQGGRDGSSTSQAQPGWFRMKSATPHKASASFRITSSSTPISCMARTMQYIH